MGTSLGSVLVISLNLPEGADDRRIQPVIVSPSGELNGPSAYTALEAFSLQEPYSG